MAERIVSLSRFQIPTDSSGVVKKFYFPFAALKWFFTIPTKAFFFFTTGFWAVEESRKILRLSAKSLNDCAKIFPMKFVLRQISRLKNRKCYFLSMAFAFVVRADQTAKPECCSRKRQVKNYENDHVTAAGTFDRRNFCVKRISWPKPLHRTESVLLILRLLLIVAQEKFLSEKKICKNWSLYCFA